MIAILLFKKIWVPPAVSPPFSVGMSTSQICRLRVPASLRVHPPLSISWEGLKIFPQNPAGTRPALFCISEREDDLVEAAIKPRPYVLPTVSSDGSDPILALSRSEG
eukprot:1179317-Prorocentrum_minimum.AAC.10